MPEGGGASARPLILVVLAAIVAGLPSLSAGFIHDDHRIIEQNELIRDPAHVPAILTRGYWTVDERQVPNLYRPVTILSFALSHAVGGLRPFGYRAANLALHALVAALVYLLARRTFGLPSSSTALASRIPGAALDPALWAGLLFAVHPVHTEVLGLVVGRGEILAAAGTILSVLLFLRGVERAAAGETSRARRMYVLSLSAFAFGFLSKENAVAAPFLTLAADLTLRRDSSGRPVRPAWGYHAGSAALLVLLLGVRATVLGGLGTARFTHFIDNPIAYQPFLLGRLTALKALAEYARLLVFPLRLSIDHSYNALPPAASAAEPLVVAGGVVLLAGALGLATAWKRRRAAAFALAFVALALAPVSNLLVPIGTILAERLLYLPSVGACLLAGALVSWSAARAPGASGAPGGSQAPAVTASIVASVPLVAVVGLLGARSIVRLLDWRDDRSIFASAIAVTPGSARAQFNYGSASEDAGDDVDAERGYRAALAIWPAFSDAHYNLAGLLARRQGWAEAIEHYRQALAEQPGNVTYLVNLGHALSRAGRPEEALVPLEKAVGLDASSDRGWTNLGTALLRLGRGPEAVRAYREASRLAPDNVEYLMNLGMAQEAGSDTAAAAISYAAAAERRPADPILRYRLGRALEQAGRPSEAAAAYREAIRLSPESPVPRRSLGLLLFRSGDLVGAREALERAEALDAGGQVMDDEARRLLDRLRQTSSR
jgi:tetratricopeptide (TPR) repeat protein